MKRVLVAALVVVSAGGCRALFEFQLDGEGRAYPCRLDAGEDPADGGNLPGNLPRQCFADWRCGLEVGQEAARCHKRGEPRAYVCVDDSQCEAEWTCGIESFCIPPVDDAFRPGVDETVGRIVEHVSQKVLLRTPDTVAVVADQVFAAGFNGSAIGFTVGEEFTLMVRTRFGPPGFPTIGSFTLDFVRDRVPAGVNDLGASLAVGLHPILLTDDGAGYLHLQQRMDMTFLPDAPYQRVWPDVRQEQLRIIPQFPPYVLAFGDGGTITELRYPADPNAFVRGASPDAGFFSVAYPNVASFEDGGSQTFRQVNDVTSIVLNEAGDRTLLMASVDGQLFHAERWFITDAGPPRVEFQKLVFTGNMFAHAPNSVVDGGPTLPFFTPANFLRAGGTLVPYVPGQGYAFGGPVLHQAGRVRVRGQRFAVELVSPGSDAGELMLAQEFYEAGGPLGFEPVPFATLLLAPCQACRNGTQLVDFRPYIPPNASVAMSIPPSIEVRCADALGRQVTLELDQAVGTSGCGARVVEPTEGPPTVVDSVLADISVVGSGGWIGGHGQAWFGDSLMHPHALFLDGTPTSLVRGGNDVAAFRDDTIFFLRQDAGRGFVAESGLPEDGIDAVASVIGRDEWVLIDDMFVARQAQGSSSGSGEAVAFAGRSIDTTTVRPPYFAVAARTNDGGAVIIASANDALFSADVSGIFDDASGPPGTMEFRHVPVNRVPIQSLAAIDVRTDGGPYANGWVLTRANLIEFTAADIDRWSSRPLPVPPGAMLEVWADHDRGRLGFIDGRVYSLPGLKLLARPLDAGVVYDYYQFKGQSWAIAANGVWRLRGGADGGVGEWYQDVQPPTDAGSITFEGARFFEGNGALYLFTVHGVTVRFR